MPSISIVLPIYNGLPFLQEALQSIFAQTFTDWELLIADDRSTDGSWEVITAISDRRVRAVQNGVRRGIFGNLNDLIARASAPYVKIFCQDDRLAPRCLEQQLAAMQAHPSAAVSRVLNLDSGSSAHASQDEGLRSLPSVIMPDRAPTFFFLHGNIPGNLSNTMFRREVWTKLGGFREDLPFSGDMEFWFRCARVYPLLIVPEPLSWIRDHPQQASSHLNRANELVAQMDFVLGEIYAALPLRGRGVARCWGTLIYCTQYLHHGLRATFRGRWSALRPLLRRRTYAWGLVTTSFFYVASGNRRWGTVWFRRCVLKALSPAAT